MKICALTAFKEGQGDILVLEDMHTEGIHIRSQHKRVEDAVQAIRNSYSPHVAIVRVIKLDITELQQELPL